MFESDGALSKSLLSGGLLSDFSALKLTNHIPKKFQACSNYADELIC